MHILFLTDNFPPEVNAPASRTWEHIQVWDRLGARITVITSQPNFPTGHVFCGYANRIIQRRQVSERVAVVRVWTYMAPNTGSIRRIIDYLSFAIASFFAGLTIPDVDIIIATSPQFFTVWSGCALAKLRRIPWIFELRDIWPQSIVTVGAMKKGLLFFLLEKIELFLYARADAIIAVTESFRRDLMSRGIKGQKIFVVKNGVDISAFHPKPKNMDLQKKLSIGLERKIVVGYIGTIGMAHGIGTILEAARQSPNIDYLIVGDGADRRILELQVLRYNLHNVHFTGMIPRSSIPDYISIIDVMIVCLKRRDEFRKVIPSKIFECCALGKPILLGVEGEAQELIETYGAGVCFQPENAEELLQKLNFIVNNPQLYQRLQTGAKRLSSEHDREQLAKRMFQIIEHTAAKQYYC